METKKNQNSQNIAIGIDFGNKETIVAMWNPKKRSPVTISTTEGQSKPIASSAIISEDAMKGEEKITQKEQPNENQKENSINNNNKQDNQKKMNEKEEEDYDFGKDSHLMEIEEVIQYDSINNRKYAKLPNYEPYYKKDQNRKEEEDNQSENYNVFNDEPDFDNQKNQEKGRNYEQNVQNEIKEYPFVVPDLKQLIGEKLNSSYIQKKKVFFLMNLLLIKTTIFALNVKEETSQFHLY